MWMYVVRQCTVYLRMADLDILSIILLLERGVVWCLLQIQPTDVYFRAVELPGLRAQCRPGELAAPKRCSWSARATLTA